jgi:acetyl esterase/lipase
MNMKSLRSVRILAFLLLWTCIFTASNSFAQEKKTQIEKPRSKNPQTKNRESFGEDQQLVYKKCDGGNLKLYLFIPDERNAKDPRRPAIVFFFGGGWVSGTPNQFKPHAEYLKSRGMIAVLADYRTRRSHQTSPKECVADAKSSIRYLRSHSKKLGIDPDRIAAGGGSAGGHLAAATATLKEFDDEQDDHAISSVPNALVLFNPVYDNGPNQWGHKSVKDYWQKISPAENIRKGIPPAIVFLGDSDKLVPVETAQSFQAKMQKVSAKSELHIYKDKGHGFFNFGRHRNEPFQDTVEKMDQFLAAEGFLQGKPTVEQFLESKK